VSPFRVLVVDNHDSFVHTLAGYVTELGAEVALIEADEIDPARVPEALAGVDAVLVSPGPGDPEHAGSSIAVVRTAAALGIPLLGVCLGHQAIAVAFGGTVGHAPELLHGMTSSIAHDASTPFEGLAQGFAATRYHSLAIVPETLPEVLRVTARTASGVVMGVAHRDAPIWGVQFHPESILTEGGYRIIGNWLEAAGMSGAADRGAHRHPLGGAA
jgi:para-aminobenzoate synthetase component II